MKLDFQGRRGGHVRPGRVETGPLAFGHFENSAVAPGPGELARLGRRRVRLAPDMGLFERPLAGFFQSPREGAWRSARGRARSPRPFRDACTTPYRVQKLSQIAITQSGRLVHPDVSAIFSSSDSPSCRVISPCPLISLPWIFSMSWMMRTSHFPRSLRCLRSKDFCSNSAGSSY